MRHLDLFSGIGGFALAARRVGWETVGFCDNDPFCQAVLAQHWPGVPIYDDVRTFDVATARPVDIVTGGYPCQPFSLAGKRGGSSDDRHLWPAMHRIIHELRPTWVVGENVAGHISMGLDDVLSDLERSGYACRTFAIPAVAVDAKHRRERLWVVAHSGGERRQQVAGSAHGDEGADEGRTTLPTDEPASGGEGSRARSLADTARDEQGRIEQRPERQRARSSGESEHVSDAAQFGRGQGSQDAGGCSEGTRAAEERRGSAEPCRWLPEPNVGRVANGIPARVDRLRSLGNAIVPQVAEEIFRAIDAIRMTPPESQTPTTGERRHD